MLFHFSFFIFKFYIFRMKRILTIAILCLFIVPTNAKIHLGVEAGFGNTAIKAGYNTSPSGMFGVMLGKEFKVLLVDVGVRSWSCSYSAIKEVSFSGTTLSGLYDANLINISVPVSAGIYLPLGKVNILAKAIIAPTFITKHDVKAEVTNTAVPILNAEDYTKRYFTAAGCDIGIGYSFSKRISLDAKYSLLAAVSDLKHDPVIISANAVLLGEGERPRINAFALQLNFFL
jgi:hypothetical protein